MLDALSQFRDAIRAAGLEPPEVIEAGKLHRFPGIGKRQSNRAGWCKLFDDGLGGCFGDWSSGFTKTWQAKRDQPFTALERAAFKQHVAKAQTQAQAERRAKQVDAATRAVSIWRAASAAPSDHPYLIRKGIKVNDARFYKGSLLLPVTDFTGKLTSLQFIEPNGRKLLLSGGRKRGCFIPVAGDMAGERPGWLSARAGPPAAHWLRMNPKPWCWPPSMQAIWSPLPWPPAAVGRLPN